MKRILRFLFPIRRKLKGLEMDMEFIVEQNKKIIHQNNFIIQKLSTMANNLDDITANVAKTTTAEQSAVLLLGELKSRLDAAGTDPAALKALSDELGSNADSLAAAVVANTPSEVPPTQ